MNDSPLHGRLGRSDSRPTTPSRASSEPPRPPSRSRSTAPTGAQGQDQADTAAIHGRIADLLEQLAEEHRELAGILQNQLDARPDPRLMSSVEARPNPLLSAREVAVKLGLSERTIRRHRQKGILPPAIEVGGTYRWRAEDIEAWIASGGSS